MASIAILFAPFPAGVQPSTVRAAALVVFTVGLWAGGMLPEHITGLLFFILAMIFMIAPPEVIFSGFTSATLWLVLGGLILAQGVIRTGLAKRLVSFLFGRFTLSYWQIITATVILSVALAFFMPATIGRILLLIPILVAVAERAGFERGSAGYNGICLAAIMSTYQCGTAILPANAPNLVLAGAAETLYRVQLLYAEYLWLQFPVLGILKGLLIIVFVCRLFRAEVIPPRTHKEYFRELSPDQWRMAVILVCALVLWATDFIHGIKAGWIALAAGTACLLPRIGAMPVAEFNDVKLAPFFYIGATLGLGLMIQKSGLSNALENVLHGALALSNGANFHNFVTLSILSTFAGLFTTNTAQPAVLAPLAGYFAQVTGWSLKSVLMTMAVGFSTLVLPYQVPPVVVGLQVSGVRLREALKLTVPLAIFSLLVLMPLDYLWWKMIGFLE